MRSMGSTYRADFKPPDVQLHLSVEHRTCRFTGSGEFDPQKFQSRFDEVLGGLFYEFLWL
jgi:hypothetical protein